MSYYLGKVLPLAFDEAVTRTMEALKKEGFGVLTDIDVADSDEVGRAFRMKSAT